LQITYLNKRVQKYFEDYEEMKKKIPVDWVRAVKKHINRLRASATFGDFLKLNLGHPEPLKGNSEGKYSIHITGNVRLIIEPSEKGEAVRICGAVQIEGIADYHGSKENWYIN